MEYESDATPPHPVETTARVAEEQFQDWLKTPLGEYILTWEQKATDTMVADIFGYWALQVGLPYVDFLRASRIISRFSCANINTPSGCPVFLADERGLPIDSDSLDLLILPHLLERTTDPHQVLREAERVLRSGGEMILSGFNPASMWGLWRTMSRVMRHHLPWSARFIPMYRLKDWLNLLDFELRAGCYGCYRLPWGAQKTLRRTNALEAIGDRWWPAAGSMYILRARKRVPSMRLVLPIKRRVAKPVLQWIPTHQRDHTPSEK